MTRTLVLLTSACAGILCLLGRSIRPDPHGMSTGPTAPSSAAHESIEAPLPPSTRVVLASASVFAAPPSVAAPAAQPAEVRTGPAPVASACALGEVAEDWERRYRSLPGEDLVRAHFRISREVERFPASPATCSRSGEIAWLAERIAKAPAPTWVRVLPPGSTEDDFERAFGFTSAEDLTVEAWRLRRYGEIERERLFDERMRAGEYEVLGEYGAVG